MDVKLSILTRPEEAALQSRWCCEIQFLLLLFLFILLLVMIDDVDYVLSFSGLPARARPKKNWEKGLGEGLT